MSDKLFFMHKSHFAVVFGTHYIRKNVDFSLQYFVDHDFNPLIHILMLFGHLKI